MGINRDKLWDPYMKRGYRKFIKSLIICIGDSYLRGKLNGELSKCYNSNIGVFQGSPLSDLPFIVYIDEEMSTHNTIKQNSETRPKINVKQRNRNKADTILI